ncbi:hypothetical protein I546_7305 [Mycobacterium kansasii 732]|nr:hypothetical protein I546_7305 [Mycobacterium kansasii 732]
MSAEQAIAEWAKVNAEIRAWNARCGVENVGPLPPPNTTPASPRAVLSLNA